MKTTEFLATCPHCKETMECHSGAGAAVPRPGSLAICVYCASVLAYDDDMNLCFLGPGELDDADPEFLARLVHIQEGVKRFMRRTEFDLTKDAR